MGSKRNEFSEKERERERRRERERQSHDKSVIRETVRKRERERARGVTGKKRNDMSQSEKRDDSWRKH